jgi:nucleotide-binding universal stress UspA family protein
MYRRIIVGYRDGEQGDEAIALARSLLAEGTSGEVVIVNVLEYARFILDVPVIEQMRRDEESSLEHLTHGWPAGTTASARLIADGSPSAVLHGLDGAEDGNLIVLGSTRRGPVGRVLTGTTAGQLLHGAACPVVVAPRGYPGAADGIRTIGVGYDGSPQSRAAVGWAVDAARALGAGLRLIAVVEPPPVQTVASWGVAPPPIDYVELLETLRDRVCADLEEELAGLPAEIRAEAVVREGDPARELEGAAEDGIDLLVLGSRGFGPVKSVLLGSVSARVMRSCSVPTVVIPRVGVAPGERAAAGDAAGKASV